MTAHHLFILVSHLEINDNISLAKQQLDFPIWVQVVRMSIVLKQEAMFGQIVGLIEKVLSVYCTTRPQEKSFCLGYEQFTPSNTHSTSGHRKRDHGQHNV